MEKIFENNQKWAADKLRENPDYFTELAKGQTPRYLYIGCSDSRVPASIYHVPVNSELEQS